MGRSHLAPEVFNCSAPDTGNMEVLARYGTPEQQERWLVPLLAGDIRSAFAMTEPAVASSDATNIECSILRDGDEYVINGRKWYTTNATHPRCEIIILMGKSDPDNADRHRQQSMILVPKDTPGVDVIRPLPVFNFYGMPDRASEVQFTDVRVPATNMLLGEGRGFEIAQGRLGPGRIHHCMRLIGLAERALEMMCRRTQHRVTFGRPVAEQGVTLERIAESRIAIEQTRLLTLKTAYLMDTVGNKEARREIAMIKIAAPNMACKVVDWAIQAFGGAGTNNDYGLAAMYATARLLRLADGPDEVHRNQLAKLELRRHAGKGPIEPHSRLCPDRGTPPDSQVHVCVAIFGDRLPTFPDTNDGRARSRSGGWEGLGVVARYMASTLGMISSFSRLRSSSVFATGTSANGGQRSGIVSPASL